MTLKYLFFVYITYVSINPLGVKKMKTGSSLNSSVETLVNPGPVLAGSVRTLATTCGTPGCRCVRKNNPQKHSYNQLSYSRNGKTKTVFIKEDDVASVKIMCQNYKKFRQASLDLGHEAAELVRSSGVDAANEIIDFSFERARRLASNARLESGDLCKVRISREKWKAKALSRRLNLEKQRVRIRDLNQSRKKWKKKAVKAQKKNKVLQKKLNDANKKISQTAQKDESKKNSTEQRRRVD